LICPTEEAKQKAVEFGMPEEKIKVMGFPIRTRFCKSRQTICENENYSPLKCLIMSGGDGAGSIRREAKILLKEFDTVVNIITGRNKNLAKILRNTIQKKYPDRVEIHEFVEDVHELMMQSHLCITRGSPNVMLESAMCGLPLAITSALPGQEEGNPGFAEKYNIGVHCTTVAHMKEVVATLLENNGQGLKAMRTSQLSFRNPYAASNIVNFVVEYVKDSE